MKLIGLTGIRSPRIEKQNAPIKPMNGEIVGTAIANKTAAVTRTVLNSYGKILNQMLAN